MTTKLPNLGSPVLDAWMRWHTPEDCWGPWHMMLSPEDTAMFACGAIAGHTADEVDVGPLPDDDEACQICLAIHTQHYYVEAM